ncbi:MAG: STAS domain-containing protein [Gammaproteobacteria bacterium]
MKNQTKIEPNYANEYVVSGELNFATVPRLRNIGNQLLLQQNTIIFNFQGVSRSDSSALALLTTWTRQARRNGKKILFTHLPSQLLDIAKLSGLDSILPIQAP